MNSNNVVDNYLECVQEGKIWDKTKEFVGKHKGKIAAGIGLAAAAYAGKKGKQAYDNNKMTPQEKAVKDREEKQIVARLQAKHDKENQSKINRNAVGYAIGKTVNTATKPFRWIAGKAGKAIGNVASSGATSAKNALAKSVRDKYDDIKYRNKIKKRKQQSTTGAIFKGLKGE